MKQKVQSEEQGPCNGGAKCSGHHSSFSFSKIMPAFWKFVHKNTKYAYYVIVLILFPTVVYRFFIKFNDYSLQAFLELTWIFSMIGMAYWSHTAASQPNNPGWLEWEHFRTPEQLEDISDKLKWNDPAYRRRKWLASQDPENENVNSIECVKCGCMKVEGVHHCGQCGRCVYKMDHHCPWTDNCVGFFTLKPFLLFLFYVSCLTFSGILCIYKAAWDNDIRHISILNFWSSTSVRHFYIMKFAPEYEIQKVLQENRETYEAQKNLVEGDPDDIFSLQAFKDVLGAFTLAKSNPFCSKEAVYDHLTMLGLAGFGLYTLFLFVQTVYYVRCQSSLVDSHKYQRFWSLSRQQQKLERMKQPSYLKKYRPLSFKQICQAILGEDSISLFSFIPQHRSDRKIQRGLSTKGGSKCD